MARRGWSTAGIGVAATIVGGLGTYVLLIAAARALPARAYDEFSVWWSLSLLIWLGIFMPHEQDLARGGGSADRPTRIAVSARVSGVMIVGVAVVIGCTAPLLAGAVGLSWWTIGMLLLWVIAAALMGSTRGTLIADRRPGAVTAAIATEGGARLVLAAALLLTTMTGYPLGAAVPAGGVAVIAVLVYLAFRPHGYFKTFTAPAPGWGGQIVSTLVLVAAGIGAQTLINAGPVVVRAMTSETGQAGAFQSTFSLARIPLFVLVPLQSLLIPVFGRLVSAHDAHRARRLTLWISSGAIAAAGIIGLTAALAGPWATGLLFGSSLALDPLSTGLLWAAVTLYVAQTVLSQALIAVHRLASVAIAWSIALVAAIAALGALAQSGQSAVTVVAEALTAGALAGLIAATWCGVRSALPAAETV